jgi:hypothetical protein
MKQISRARLAVLVLATTLAATSCKFSTTSKKATNAQPLADGQTIGKIERLPGGTAVASEVITLLNLSCVGGQLIVRTNLQNIVGKMDCAQQVPQATLDRFYGQSVTVSYAGSRLRIDSVSAGTIELSVTGATITEFNATP